jgi:hypothetical protein
MGSAELRYDAAGRVAWGEIWTTFCHLALAGGPPHRGRLLGPVSRDEAEASPEQQREVVAELRRALGLCVELPLSPDPPPGWIGLTCPAAATAAWLVQAVVAENVIARHVGETLLVPAGPHFRIEKEIKNVVVSVAKTCHYLFDHLEPEQQPNGPARPLVEPPLPEELAAAPEAYAQAAAELATTLHRTTGLPAAVAEAPGWVGLACPDEEAAVWLLRAVAVEDVLVRREGATLVVPVALGNGDRQPLEQTHRAVTSAHRLWRTKS